MYENGKKKKEIARFLKINIKTVRYILSEETGEIRSRKDKITIDSDLLKSLYERCDGYAQRVYEILSEEHNITIGYSTLTRLLKEYGIGEKPEKRDQRYPDVPGDEMQQDTSVYTVTFDGNKRRKVICSGIYLRYSKIRYVKFYYRFNRFIMKCFFHEALRFLGYTAKTCIIDNTSLAVDHGTGERAVFSAEMLSFAAKYGFRWKAHRIRLANRKAGKERNFITLETNFFPVRRFKDIDDLNRQAFDWATRRFAIRPQSKTRLIPKVLFEQEKPYLIKLPTYIDPPYQEHKRTVDRYGYISFNANFFWIPDKISGELTVIEYEKQIHIYQKNIKLLEYDLPALEVRNKEIYPKDKPRPPRMPQNRKYGCREEEKKLRQMGTAHRTYLEYIQSAECRIHQKPRLIRELYRLSKKMSPSLFLETIERANEFRVTSIESIERIARQLLKHGLPDITPELPFPDPYEQRQTYQEGRFSSEADLDKYRKLLEQEEEKDE